MNFFLAGAVVRGDGTGGAFKAESYKIVQTWLFLWSRFLFYERNYNGRKIWKFLYHLFNVFYLSFLKALILKILFKITFLIIIQWGVFELQIESFTLVWHCMFLCVYFLTGLFTCSIFLSFSIPKKCLWKMK